VRKRAITLQKKEKNNKYNSYFAASEKNVKGGGERRGRDLREQKMERRSSPVNVKRQKGEGSHYVVRQWIRFGFTDFSG